MVDQRLDEKPVITSTYRGYVLEYHPTLGWIYFMPGDEMCTLVRLPRSEKRVILKKIDKDGEKRFGEWKLPLDRIGMSW